MPNTSSAKKAAKQNIKRRQKNLTRRTALKTAVKKVLIALDKGQDPVELLRQAESQLARAKGKSVIHRNTAARKISRLAKKVAAAQKSKQPVSKPA